VYIGVFIFLTKITNLLNLKNQEIQCPYCGEYITIFIDCSIENQSYIEDCQVCCRPINLIISVGFDGDVQVNAMHENE
tara:strand:- start:288 stop:521 length:234 start_codon:yes stop_codon:yes gene_type:complete